MAGRAFGDPAIYLERLVERARHVEIQVFGFGDGRAVHLHERDCSLQRRFQKVVEESPAPGLPAALRDAMAQAAVALCRHESYRGAGTVEFVVDAQRMDFHFLEMNCRIQVEHPVTEMITGTDLVAWQIELARGNLRPFWAEPHRRIRPRHRVPSVRRESGEALHAVTGTPGPLPDAGAER